MTSSRTFRTPSPPTSHMNMDNFRCISVLGRGHFGKVWTRSGPGHFSPYGPTKKSSIFLFLPSMSPPARSVNILATRVHGIAVHLAVFSLHQLVSRLVIIFSVPTELPCSAGYLGGIQEHQRAVCDKSAEERRHHRQRRSREVRSICTLGVSPSGQLFRPLFVPLALGVSPSNQLFRPLFVPLALGVSPSGQLSWPLLASLAMKVPPSGQMNSSVGRTARGTGECGLGRGLVTRNDQPALPYSPLFGCFSVSCQRRGYF